MAQVPAVDSSAGLQAELAQARQSAANAEAEVEQLSNALSEAQISAEDRDFAARQALALAHQEIEDLEQRMAEHDQQLAEAQARVAADAAASAQCKQELQQLRTQQASEITRLNAEREQLVEQLRGQHEQELQELRTQLAADPAASDKDFEDLQKLHAMAIQDLRELRAEKERLAKQLSAVHKSPAASPAALIGFDWESQKQRLLAQLEDDFDDSDAVQAKDRLTIEGAIRITDDVVAARDKEIAELKELLQQQAENIGSFAVGASAVADVLDRDELIKAERDNLVRMQEELRDKLRHAEVEASLERARLSREHASLEEKLRLLEQEKSHRSPVREPAEPEKSKSSRRWLSRLGLKEE